MFLLVLLAFTFLCTISTRATMQFSHNHFHYGAQLTPHPSKIAKGGEDAFFANSYVLAVADGVGGWNLQGIDPSKYSKQLCTNVGILLRENSEYYETKPKEIIREAAKRDPHEGSSTFVVVTIDKEKPILRTSYIGDSIYVVYRKQNGKWDSVIVAEEHQRSFNFPYQLGNAGGDRPDMALEFVHTVQDKDIVIVASDGLFDNMFPEQVLRELIPFIDEEDEVKDPKAAADQLAKVAYDLSLNKNYNSPFSQRGLKAKWGYYKGGKSDDITVIVGQVKLAQKGNETISDEASTASESSPREKVQVTDEL